MKTLVYSKSELNAAVKIIGNGDGNYYLSAEFIKQEMKQGLYKAVLIPFIFGEGSTYIV